MRKMMAQMVSGMISGLLEKKKERMFFWLVCGAAALVVASCQTEKRPTDLLSDVVHEFGLGSASRWLSTGLPPAIAHDDPVRHEFFATLAGLLVLWLAVGVVVRVVRESSDVAFEAKSLIGARAPGTVWILLLVVAQYGPIKPLVARWLTWAFATFVIFLVVACAARFVLDYVDRRLCHMLPLGVCADWIKMVVEGVSNIVLVAVLSLILSAADPLVRVISWWCATESDARVKGKEDVIRIMAQNRRGPTGAMDPGVVERRRVERLSPL